MYRFVPPAEANQFEWRIRQHIKDWVKKHKQILSRGEKKFLLHELEENKSPFPVFYLTMKVHKDPWVSRPIVSCSGSLLHPLGLWVDSQLQKVARTVPSYFGSSYKLKQELVALELPPGAKLFTANARSMYTNIPTHQALRIIGQYLRRNAYKFPDIPIDALMEALRLIMTHNLFTFGDTHWLQRTGTTMGTPPAPPWATLFYAIHEAEFVILFLEHMPFYRRFIDDVVGVWLPDACQQQNSQCWQQLKDTMNNFFGLTWDFIGPSDTVDYMDLTISVRGTRIHTTLFEKKLNLYLYIPPPFGSPARCSHWTGARQYPPLLHALL